MFLWPFLLAAITVRGEKQLNDAKQENGPKKMERRPLVSQMVALTGRLQCCRLHSGWQAEFKWPNVH